MMGVRLKIFPWHLKMILSEEHVMGINFQIQDSCITYVNIKFSFTKMIIKHNFGMS